MAEEPEFEVVDRRRVRAEDLSTEPVAEASEAGEAPESEEQSPDYGAADLDSREEDLTGMPAMDMGVTAILVTTLNMLDARAWASLGLVPDPMTGKIEKDLPEARRAIDALADVMKHLESHATDAEKREMQGNLSNLRINYVRLSG